MIFYIKSKLEYRSNPTSFVPRPTSYGTRISNQTSFTLLELLLAMLILFVLIGLAVPNFQGTYQKLVLNQTARDIADLMRYAQSKAILNQTPYQLRLNSDEGSYGLEQESRDSTSEEISYVPVPGWSGRRQRIPAKIKIQSELKTVLFKPDGTIEPVEIELCGRDGCLQISTAKRRGLVQLKEKPNS